MRTRRRLRSNGWSAALLLLLLTTAIHYDVIFQGRSLVLTNHFNPLDYRLLPQNYGEDLVGADAWTRRNLVLYPNIRDPGGSWWQWEPSGAFLRKSMQLAEWPFWDPFIGGGTPAMANLTPAFFFPPYTAMIALGGSVHLKNVYLLLLVWGAAFVSYLFLRAHGLAFVSSLFGGTVVLMSGALNQSLGTIMGQTTACLPLALYATRLMLDAPTLKRTAGLAIVYAAVALSSFPPLLLGIFGFTALYAVLALAFNDTAGDASFRRRAALLWMGAVIVSVGLTGFYYLPVAALYSTHPPQVAAAYDGAGLEAVPMSLAYQLLSPTLFGGMQVYIATPFSTPGSFQLPYVGIVAMIAALLAGSESGRRERTLFVASLVAGVFVVLKIFGIPPVQWAAYLPILKHIHFAHYWGALLGFVFAFLGALGVERLIRGSASGSQVLIVAVAAVVATESLWWVASELQVFSHKGGDYWIRDWKVLATITVCSSAAIALSAASARRLAGTVAATCLFALVAAEGVYNNSYPNPAAWDIFDNPVPYVRVLQEGSSLRRVFSFGAPNANLNSAFGVFSMDSLFVFNPPRAYSLYHRYAKPAGGLLMRSATAIPPEPVLDRANIAVLGINKAFIDIVKDARSRGYRQLFDDGFVVLFERPTLPRFFFASQYRVVHPDDALESIAAPNTREIVLEKDPGFASSPNLLGDPDVRVEAYRRNSVTVVVDAPRPGLVYASESFFDGWTARVNWAPAEILPANYAFRAVAVPEGRSRIEFRYWPPGLTSGLWMSGISAACLLALIVVPASRERRDPTV